MPQDSNTAVESYVSQPQLPTETPAQYKARQQAAQRLIIADIAGNTSSQKIAAQQALQLTNAAVSAAAAQKTAVPTDGTMAAAGVSTVQSAGNATSGSLVNSAPATSTRSQATQSPNAALTRGLRGRTGQNYIYDNNKPGGVDITKTGQSPPTFIEVMQLPASATGTENLAATTAAPLLKYNDFFITDSQEMDAEKAEVSETFGAPHVFATGRYMRKVSIAGVARTGPVNPGITDIDAKTGAPLFPSTASGSDLVKARFIVPQTLGLRVFYDRALRASEQIARGLYSRLHIDGEVYSGWFTTLNMSRSGADESLAHFTMSMLVFDRYHKDESWASKLFNVVTAVPKNAFTDTVAAATLAAQKGQTTIAVSPTSGQVKPTVTETAPDATDPQHMFGTDVKLTVSGKGDERIAVLVTYAGPNGQSVVVQGFTLGYGQTLAARQPLGGASPSNGSYSLFPIIDFNSLVKSIASAGTTLAGTLQVPLTVQMAPASSNNNPISFSVTLSLNTQRTPKIVGLSTVFTSGTDRTTRQSQITAAANSVFSGLNLGLSMIFNLQDSGGNPLGLATGDVSAITLELMDPNQDGVSRKTSGPVLGAQVGTLGAVDAIELNVTAASGAASVSSATLTLVETDTTQVRLDATFAFAQLAAALGGITDLGAANPFSSASTLTVGFRFKLGNIPNSSDILTPPVEISATYPAGWMGQMLSSLQIARSGGATATSVEITELVFGFSPAPALNMASRVNTEPGIVRDAVIAIVGACRFAATPANIFADFSNPVVTAMTPTTVTVKASADLQDANTPFIGLIEITVPSGIVPIAGLDSRPAGLGN